ncbi:c-type cytochrome biogenesis protein CcsB [Nocardioides sp. SYSU D00038]|uniref:c-type cytochrome biogenesis protein CcsB n=1 Tax=Nocardioides sp. SYSU D00038 TaxID=2812554 RepID=UPI0019678FB0|nr:c-type cytochrome biogenesis protein CcsB [Nocardioides sp. SYSU D00038]
MSDADWSALSNTAIAVAGGLYFLALVAHLVEWSALAGRRQHETATTEAAEGGGVAVATGPADDLGSGSDREERVARFARIGLAVTVLALVAHLVALVARGLAADPNRVPWGNMYEFTMAGTFVVAAGYVGLYRRFRLAWMAPLVVGLVVTLLMVAVIWLYNPVGPLSDSLNSPWLVIHVVSAVLATGAFTLGGILSATYLVKMRRPVGPIMSRVPELAALDRTAYRIHAFAFPVWTFAVLITGPIWAHQAWSSYWNWDPKEVWAFITWVVYAAYLHARSTAGWKGRNAALLALVGMATLWFNFIGINYFSTTSQHSYADAAAVVERP